MAPRTFFIKSYTDEHGITYGPDRDELAELVGDLIGSIHRLGGIFNVAAHREEVAPGQFETTAFIVQHDKHSPAVKLPKQAQEAPVPEAEDEPSAGG